MIEASVNGTADLHAYGLPADRANAIKNRLHESAFHLNTSDETRSMDQLRTDTFLDLLDGQDQLTARPNGNVSIHVNLLTLTELSETPGELAGYGPVIADVARQVAKAQSDGIWEVIVTDGHKVGLTSTTSRRPTSSMRRRLIARHPRCVYPGCRTPSRDADIDHNKQWAKGGRTMDRNLSPLCRRHHQAKDVGQWAYRAIENGFAWVSPLGHTYVTERGPPHLVSVR